MLMTWATRTVSRTIGATAAASLIAGCGGDGTGETVERADPAADAPIVATASPAEAARIQGRALELEAEVEAGLPAYDSIHGRGKSGDLTYDFSAHFDGEDLRLIREHQDSGDYGHSDNDYFFVDGALTYYVQGQISRVLNPAGPPTSDAIVLRLYFDPEGRLEHAEKTLNGAPVPLEGYEELSVRRRSAALREAALAGGGVQEIAVGEPLGPVAIEFEPGSSTVVHEGIIVSREIRSYLVSAERGQRLSVDLDSESRYVQFVVQFVGQSVYDSRRSGVRSWSDQLPRDGEYTVRVYLGRGEAERGGSAEYELTIGLAEGSEPRP
jgi:hypothetical protein